MLRSAEVIVPLVLKLIPVRSVVDVGCGDGSWLAIFQKFGVRDVLGIDGEHVHPADLQISSKCFRALDLSEPFHLERKFDLALSLEVAEHLPPAFARGFVESLTQLSSLVLFSAAIPFQGGVNHVNEQWPDVWAKFFEARGYLPIDFVRKQVWQNEAVSCWYAQNTILFARTEEIGTNVSLKTAFELTNTNQLSVVHPQIFLLRVGAQPCATSRPEPLTSRGPNHFLRTLWRSVRLRSGRT